MAVKIAAQQKKRSCRKINFFYINNIFKAQSANRIFFCAHFRDRFFFSIKFVDRKKNSPKKLTTCSGSEFHIFTIILLKMFLVLSKRVFVYFELMSSCGSGGFPKHFTMYLHCLCYSLFCTFVPHPIYLYGIQV